MTCEFVQTLSIGKGRLRTECDLPATAKHNGDWFCEYHYDLVMFHETGDFDCINKYRLPRDQVTRRDDDGT